jgi:hypothetical protein
LTEEKRGEIDLESLWSGILRRGTQLHVEDAEDAEALSTGNASTPEALPESIRPAGTAGPSSILGQTRGFHTSARRLLQEVEPAATAGSTANDFEALNLDQLRKSAMQNIVSGDYLKASNVLLQASPLVPQLQNGGWRLCLLDLLRTYLSSLPRDQALQELGNSDSPTPFITCFKDALSLYPTEFEAESRIWLHVYARGLEHPDYDKGNLYALMDELLLAGVRISRPAYIYALRSLILPGTRGGTSTKSLNAATTILEAMYEQGMDILTEDIFVELQEAAAATPAQVTSPYQVYTHPDDTHDLPGMRMTPVQRRLHVLTKTIDLPPFSDESRMRLMHLHAKNQYWLEFWDIFRMAPRQGQPNSAAMYAFMFSTVAQTEHQKACMNVLRTWTAEMGRERPPVALQGEVAEAIKACLRVADPYIEQAVVDAPDAKGEWLSMWQKCRWTGGQNDPFLYD